MNEFKVNNFLTLKLEKGKTNIYIKGERIKQCKFLMLNIPIQETERFKEIESIDEAADILGWRNDGQEGIEYSIDPETEFWGHCSNLQAWYENDYDTRILHSNLAFPLLRRLTDCGDPLAKKVFKEEIAKRLESGFSPVVLYLIKGEYLSYLNTEELKVLVTMDEIWQGVLTTVETMPDGEDRVNAFCNLISVIKGTDLMREKSTDLLTAVETMPDDLEKNVAFYNFIYAIKGTDLMDRFSSRIETTFSNVLAAVETVPDYWHKLAEFHKLLFAIKSTNLMDTLSSQIETAFSNILAAVETVPNDQNKCEAFRELLNAIEGTDLMNIFSARIRKIF